MQQNVIIVTGLSGAGKTVALRALEDSGYFCIDNFPIFLLRDLLNLSTKDEAIERIATGVDVREKGFLKGIEDVIQSIKKHFRVEVLFLEAEQSVLLRRFKETRRPHPLLRDSDDDIQKAMQKEYEMLKPLRDMADRVIDTSSLTPHQLRSIVMGLYGDIDTDTMSINLISFGYKFGVPQNIDLLFDVRFLPNPHYEPDLRPLTGLDQPVKEYVMNDPMTEEVMRKLKDLLKTLMQGYIKEGKSVVNIGFGCTGGRHRSPVIVEEIRSFMEKELNLKPKVIHREI